MSNNSHVAKGSNPSSALAAGVAYRLAISHMTLLSYLKSFTFVVYCYIRVNI